MKLVRPQHKQLPNVVQFIVSTEMTQQDVKNYLEKIYNVPVIQVKTTNIQGRTKQDSVQGYVTKEDDFKMAYVTLPKDQHFEFPEMFAEGNQMMEEQVKQMDEMKKNHKKFLDQANKRPGVPGWFSF
ncbi:putative 39S ribosomal protein L23 [Blattella germanica]|nr:putative 39S ribosomal protein L23 [Blattella germanica]